MENEEKNGGPNHLKAWRIFRQLSQAELAARVGTTQHNIGYLESGERGLSAKWLRKLATASNRQRLQIAEIAKTLLRDGTDG